MNRDAMCWIGCCQLDTTITSLLGGHDISKNPFFVCRLLGFANRGIHMCCKREVKWKPQLSNSHSQMQWLLGIPWELGHLHLLHCSEAEVISEYFSNSLDVVF